MKETLDYDDIRQSRNILAQMKKECDEMNEWDLLPASYALSVAIRLMELVEEVYEEGKK